MAFEPVKITGMDAEASRPSGEGALKDIVLTLSGKPPHGWNDQFNADWQQHFYMMKRRATAYGGRLTVRCVEDELEDGLLDELKKVVAQTNERYRVAVEEAEAARQRDIELARQEREKLDGLAKRLKFD